MRWRILRNSRSDDDRGHNRGECSVCCCCCSSVVVTAHSIGFVCCCCCMRIRRRRGIDAQSVCGGRGRMQIAHLRCGRDASGGSERGSQGCRDSLSALCLLCSPRLCFSAHASRCGSRICRRCSQKAEEPTRSATHQRGEHEARPAVTTAREERSSAHEGNSDRTAAHRAKACQRSRARRSRAGSQHGRSSYVLCCAVHHPCRNQSTPSHLLHPRSLLPALSASPP